MASGSDIFGHGGARDEADKLGVPFLGEVPLHMEIRRNSDRGDPIVVSKPDGDHANSYMEIVDGMIESIGSFAAR